MNPSSSSPVDLVLARLAARYGAAFLRQHAVLDLVKEDWAELLSGFVVGDVRYALDSLDPDRAPNAQCRPMCLSGDRQDSPALELKISTPDPARVAEPLSRMRGRKVH